MKCTITTFTGRIINPLDLRPEDIDIADIAHALALVNRFNGHTARPISVAQHSVFVSKLSEATMQGLLHDASEAYLGDVTKWLKNTKEMAAYRDAEERAQNMIFYKFGCFTTIHPSVEAADRLMVRLEGKQGIAGFKLDHPDYPELTQEEIDSVGFWSYWPWEYAEQEFLRRFRLLTVGR